MHDDGQVGALQGWHVDPYGRFDERYYTYGDPTSLVRTARVESRDAPTPAVTNGAQASAANGDDARPAGGALPAGDAPAAPLAGPILYEHRRHPIAAPIVGAVMLLTPLSVWIALTAHEHGRLYTVANFAIVVAALVTLVWFSRRDRVDPGALRPVHARRDRA